MAITELGDSGVLSLITLITVVYLFLIRSWRAAGALFMAFLIAVAGTALAKLLFLGCIHEASLGIRSPSGHTALSLAVYIMLAVLFSSQLKGSARMLPYIIATGLVSMIAISRVILKYHTAEEVFTGLLLGSASVIIACLFLFYKRQNVTRFNIYMVMLIIGITAATLHGNRLPAEKFIRLVAAELKHYIPVCREA